VLVTVVIRPNLPRVLSPRILPKHRNSLLPRYNLAKLKSSACPHCKRFGSLIKHGHLYGYDQHHQLEKTIRAARVFCSNRRHANGCGRTFSVWTADKIKHMFLSAEILWKFLRQAAATGNKLQAFRALACGLSDGAAYSIWRRFVNAQASIRTALSAHCQPPQMATSITEPAQAAIAEASTLAHLAHAFKEHALSPLAAFALTLQRFVL
jgi:hypothetical protein